MATLDGPAGGDGAATRTSPSQHIGYLRALMLAAGVVSAVWQPAKVLVDSGSQQPPLMSHDFARSLGCRLGGPSGTHRFAPFEQDTDIHTLRSQDIHLTPSHLVARVASDGVRVDAWLARGARSA